MLNFGVDNYMGHTIFESEIHVDKNYTWIEAQHINNFFLALEAIKNNHFLSIALNSLTEINTAPTKNSI